VSLSEGCRGAAVPSADQKKARDGSVVFAQVVGPRSPRCARTCRSSRAIIRSSSLDWQRVQASSRSGFSRRRGTVPQVARPWRDPVLHLDVNSVGYPAPWFSQPHTCYRRAKTRNAAAHPVEAGRPTVTRAARARAPRSQALGMKRSERAVGWPSQWNARIAIPPTLAVAVVRQDRR